MNRHGDGHIEQSQTMLHPRAMFDVVLRAQAALTSCKYLYVKLWMPTTCIDLQAVCFLPTSETAFALCL
jgi:hypothetical protein